jgi:hypothetical protein
MTDTRDHLRAALADQYLIERGLGRGASATVYLAVPENIMISPSGAVVETSPATLGSPKPG